MVKNSKILWGVFQWSVLTAIVAAAMPDASLAAGIGTAIEGIRAQELSKVPNMVAAVAYTGGAVMIGSGAMKLRAHAENPGQTPMAHGIARMLAGGALAALPKAVGALTDTTHIDGTSTYSAWNPIS